MPNSHDGKGGRVDHADQNRQCFIGGNPGMYRLAKRVTITTTSTESFSTQYDAEPFDGDLLLVHEYRSADRKVIDYYCVDHVEEVPLMMETLQEAQRAQANVQIFDLKVWYGDIRTPHRWYAWRSANGLNFREWMDERFQKK